jgi:hypothetical protein
MWRVHTEMIEAKAFRTVIRIYSLFKSERLSANVKLISERGDEWRRECAGISLKRHVLKLRKGYNEGMKGLGTN